MKEERYQRLQMARFKAGFKTATEAARHHGWNENSYRSLDNGTRDITVKNAPIYAKAYKVRVEWLLYGEGVMENTASVNEIRPSLVEKLAGFDEKQQTAFEALLDSFVMNPKGKK